MLNVLLIECRVRQILSLGSHDVFISDVLAVHYNSQVLDEKGADMERSGRTVTVPANPKWPIESADTAFSKGNNFDGRETSPAINSISLREGLEWR